MKQPRTAVSARAYSFENGSLMFSLLPGSPISICLIVGGVATLAIALIYEAFFTDYGVIPASFFKDRTIGLSISNNLIPETSLTHTHLFPQA